MTLEIDKLKKSELVIKKARKDLTLIYAKNQNHNSEQVISFVEYPNGQKYMSIAPRKIKGSFKYTQFSLLFLIHDLEKVTPHLKGSKVKLITYSPKTKKFDWNSSYEGKARVENFVLKHLEKRKAILKRFRTPKRL